MPENDQLVLLQKTLGLVKTSTVIPSILALLKQYLKCKQDQLAASYINSVGLHPKKLLGNTDASLLRKLSTFEDSVVVRPCTILMGR